METPPPPLDSTAVLELLQYGELTLQGQFTHGSNYTFLGKVVGAQGSVRVVYKPRRGEQPLWDFPTGTLTRREVAAYLFSELLGWSLVPPTIYRRKAPAGPGSLQEFIPYDPQYHYFSFTAEDRQRLRPAALFDLLINNADRKGSHILADANGRLWLIDHGVCFNVEDKLRTVIWDFAGEPFPADLAADVKRVLPRLSAGEDGFTVLKPYLRVSEIGALVRRARRLLDTGVYPPPPEDRRAFPYPPL
ncbi:MAG: SCO1664 family protein [Anaerolineaceae bacterium]